MRSKLRLAKSKLQHPTSKVTSNPKDQVSSSNAHTVMLSEAKHLRFCLGSRSIPEILRFAHDDSRIAGGYSFGSQLQVTAAIRFVRRDSASFRSQLQRSSSCFQTPSLFGSRFAR